MIYIVWVCVASVCVLFTLSLIVGGAQPDEYIYIGLYRGQSVCAHADIVAASVGEGGEAGSKAGGQ